MKTASKIVCAIAAASAAAAPAETKVEFFSDRIVHVTKTVEGASRVPGTNYPVVKRPNAQAGGDRRRGADVVVAEDAAGNLTFSRPDGTVLLRENSNTANSQSWRLDADEAVFGLGIWQDERLSRRGAKKRMVNSNTEDFVPFFQSVKGYGVYWDNQSPTEFEDGESGLSFTSQVCDKIDYYFLLGDSFDGVVREMRNLTGHVPLMPKWTYGYWISRERYRSWEELLGVLGRHRQLGIPLDGIVQDWRYWGDESNYKENWNAMAFLNPEFSRRDAKEAVDEVHARGAHLMISIWPSFGTNTAVYAELAQKGLTLDFETWPPKTPNRCYDVYNPVARAVYWKYLKCLFDIGIDAWWMDATEPEHFGDAQSQDRDFDCATAMGPWRRNRNAFAIAAVEGVYDLERAEGREGKRVAIMTRSMSAGQQRTGANTWSGDISASWASLRCQIPAGLGLAACGNPNFNSDGGGFFTRGYNDKRGGRQAFLNPRYRELYVRWMQFSLFCPLMRSHGTETYREFFFYGNAGEPVYDALVKAARFRYRLLPYTYSLAGQMMLDDGSFMRPLAADFASDPAAVTNAAEFLYGKALLVRPVAFAQYTDEKVAFDDAYGSVDWGERRTCSVYLPKGAEWYDFWTGERFAGGRTAVFSGAVGDFPLYVRAGSIVPLGDDAVQFAAQQSGSPIDLRVFPGADGHFDFYDDLGDGYGYEKGEYLLIPMRWDDKAQTLTLGAAQGSYRPNIIFRVFGGLVEYKGEETTVRRSKDTQ